MKGDYSMGRTIELALAAILSTGVFALMLKAWIDYLVNYPW
jgi:hypothetical protein